MKFRTWYLGIAAVAAVLIPLSVNAAPIPTLTTGASPGDKLQFDFNGVSAENPNTIGVNPDGGAAVQGGSCNSAGTKCAETTYGVGLVSDLVDTDKSATLWTQGPGGVNNPNGVYLAFVLWGVADLSDSCSSSSPNCADAIQNTGAIGIPGYDGKIHLDFYALNAADKPCFTAGCSGNAVSAGGQYVVGGLNQGYHGITDTASATLFAQFVMQSGVDFNLSAVLDQAFNYSNAAFSPFISLGTGTGKFMANCNTAGTPGPGCTQFSQVPESSLYPASTAPTDNTQVFGQINTSILTGSDAHNLNWQLAIDDPAKSVAQVPEPASLALVGSALALFGMAIRRRRNGTIG